MQKEVGLERVGNGGVEYRLFFLIVRSLAVKVKTRGNSS